MMVAVSSKVSVTTLERMVRTKVAQDDAVVLTAPVDNTRRVSHLKRLAGRFAADGTGLMWHLGDGDDDVVLVVWPPGRPAVWFSPMRSD